VWFTTLSLKINLVFYFIYQNKVKIMPIQNTEINSKEIVKIPDDEEEKKKQMYKIYHEAQDAQYRKRKTE
jgi:ribosomal protein S3AE